MADGPCLLPAGTVLRFGSCDFVATGNGYDMEFLPIGANPNTPTPPLTEVDLCTSLPSGVPEPGRLPCSVTRLRLLGIQDSAVHGKNHQWIRLIGSS